MRRLLFRSRIAGLAAAGALIAPAVFVPAPAEGLQAEGEILARDLGCGTCHAGMPAPASPVADMPPLTASGSTSVGVVFRHLASPPEGDRAASHRPDFELDEPERLALALYLGGRDDGDAAVGAAAERHSAVTAETGRRIYGLLGCGGCHGGDAPGVGPDLSRQGARVREDWVRSWLADPTPIRGPAHPGAPGARMPDFHLTSEEAASLSSYLLSLGTPREEAPPPLSPATAERTQRLLETRVGCLGCHRLDGIGGGIGPSLDGAASRLRPEFVAEMILAPQEAAPGSPMPRQRMPVREARRLARLILDRSGPAAPAPPRPSLADPDHPAWIATPAATSRATQVDGSAEGIDQVGADLYARHCAACHGAEGDGRGWNAPTLPVPPTAHADPDLLGERPDDTLYDGIHAGAWVLDGSPRMPPFGELLDNAQIRALVRHLRSLCACAQPSWAGPVG